jgi:hypothetical protein
MLIVIPSVGTRPSLDGELPELGVLPSGGEGFVDPKQVGVNQKKPYI